MKLLVVEDEPKLNKALVQGLRQQGYVVDFVFDGEEAEQLARPSDYDLLILDVMLPKLDGFSLCKRLRAVGKMTPILFLTAKDAIEDRVTGLDLGADDYLIKPFSFDELAARVRTLLRRPAIVKGEILKMDGLQLDVRGQTVLVDGKEINLTLREFALLEYLLRNQGVVITQQDILDHVWDRFFDSFSNVVNVHIKNLRKKLPTPYAERLVTVWGKGYRLA